MLVLVSKLSNRKFTVFWLNLHQTYICGKSKPGYFENIWKSVPILAKNKKLVTAISYK